MLILSENLSLAPFGKYNLNGMLLSEDLAVSKLPYMLETNVIFIGPIELQIPFEGKLEVIVNLGNENIVVANELLDLDKKPPGFVIQAPLRIQIKNLGKMTLELRIKGKTIATRDYNVILGEAPLRNIVDIYFESNDQPGKLQIAPKQASGLLSQTHHPMILLEVFASALESLWIIDPYLEPSHLIDMMKHFTAKLRIKILTRKVTKFNEVLSTVNDAGHTLEVRNSNEFHDRFIIVNDNEVFHFGHSIKDVYAGKISRFQKLFDKDEVDAVLLKANEAWNNASHHGT